MKSECLNLYRAEHTGFNAYNKSTGTGSQEFQTFVQVGLFAVSLLFYIGTGQRSLPQMAKKNEWDISYTQPRPLASSVKSVKDQLTRFREIMGLNLSEIAKILLVSRQTIYDWLESEEPKIRKTHQDRLNLIDDICNIWSNKNLTRLGSYLHTPIGVENNSIFTSLKCEILNKDVIVEYLEEIAMLVIKKQTQNREHDEMLARHGFKPVSKDEMDDQLDGISFLD